MTERSSVAGSVVEGSAQLEEAYVYECHITRTVLEPGSDPVEATFDPRIATHQLSDDRLKIVVIIEGRVQYQYREEAYATISCAVLGEFVLRRKYKDKEASTFVNLNAVIVLWPYLRAYISSFATAMQVPFPTIPVLDVTSVVEQVAARGRTPAKSAPSVARIRKKSGQSDPPLPPV